MSVVKWPIYQPLYSGTSLYVIWQIDRITSIFILLPWRQTARSFETLVNIYKNRRRHFLEVSDFHNRHLSHIIVIVLYDNGWRNHGKAAFWENGR
jgi:hypothetical protein